MIVCHQCAMGNHGFCSDWVDHDDQGGAPEFCDCRCDTAATGFSKLRPVKQLNLDAIERHHFADYPDWSPVEPVCHFDEDPWPCETALLVAAARRAVPDGWEVAWTEDGPPDGWHFTPFLIPADDGEP